MKKRLIMVAVAVLVASGCTTMEPTSRIVYSLDAQNNLQARTETTTVKRDNPMGTALLVAAGFAGMYFLYEAYDRSTKSTTTVVNTPAAVPNNGLVAAGGTQSWSTDFLQPVYTPITPFAPAIAPVE